MIWYSILQQPASLAITFCDLQLEGVNDCLLYNCQVFTMIVLPIEPEWESI